jgi:DNA-binding Lrp family transcriptional regulator
VPCSQPAAKRSAEGGRACPRAPHRARAASHTFRDFAAGLPETVGVFVVSGGDDFLLHVAVPDTDALYAFVIDRLTERREVGDVRTSVVYEHIRRPVLEPL